MLEKDRSPAYTVGPFTPTSIHHLDARNVQWMDVLELRFFPNVRVDVFICACASRTTLYAADIGTFWWPVLSKQSCAFCCFFDMEHLIKEVRSHAALWDNRSPEYRDVTVKERAWDEISAALGKDSK
jgi:hypothetical protein